MTRIGDGVRLNIIAIRAKNIVMFLVCKWISLRSHFLVTCAVRLCCERSREQQQWPRYSIAKTSF